MCVFFIAYSIKTYDEKKQGEQSRGKDERSMIHSPSRRLCRHRRCDARVENIGRDERSKGEETVNSPPTLQKTWLLLLRFLEYFEGSKVSPVTVRVCRR